MNFDQILERLFVGSCPESVGDIDRLRREAGVTAVLNLQTDEDFDRLGLDWVWLDAHYRASAIDVRRVPVRDFDPEDLQKKLPACVAVLGELLGAGHTVYVHCTAGAGRSANTVIAYLHWVARWDLHAAAAHVFARRVCSPDPEAIRLAAGGFLREFGDAGRRPA